MSLVNNHVVLGRILENENGVRFGASLNGIRGIQARAAGLQFGERLSGLLDKEANVSLPDNAMRAQAIARKRVTVIPQDRAAFNRTLRFGDQKMSGIFDFLTGGSIPSRNELLARYEAIRKQMEKIVAGLDQLTSAQKSGILEQMNVGKISPGYLQKDLLSIQAATIMKAAYVTRIERYEAGLPGVQKTIDEMQVGNQTAGIETQPQSKGEAKAQTTENMVQAIDTAIVSKERDILRDYVVPGAAIVGGLTAVVLTIRAVFGR